MAAVAATNTLATGYLICGHCGVEFLGSARQLKRQRLKATTGTACCSQACAYAVISAKKRRPFPYNAICPTCGKSFGSRMKKIYCCLKCYVTSPEFKARLAKNHSSMVRASVVAALERGEELVRELTCLHCGKKWMVPFRQRHRRFCSHLCYRQYMAARFDRWIANPQAIALPQAYDEFMTQEEFPCLIDGCTWTGKHLGNHVNRAHGILASDFKRAAGFNLNTGLVTPATSAMLASWPRQIELHRAVPIPQPLRRYVSLEAKEHKAKAEALRDPSFPAGPPRICVGCGASFQPLGRRWNSKYCTVECRNRHYLKNNQIKQFWLRCARCDKDFQGNLYQQQRAAKAQPVACSLRCKQLLNSHSRKGEE